MRFCQWYLLLGLGLGIAATGAIFFLAWRDIFDILVTEEKSLLPGTALYKEWRRPTVHPRWQFYAFNWTNAATFLEDPKVAPASFRELGPFTYDEHTEVVDVKFHPGNGTLSYRKRTFFRIRQEGNGGGSQQHDNVTSINFVALLAAFLAQNMDYSVQRELSFLLHNYRQSATLTRPAGQLLFGGYREPLLEQVRKIVCAQSAVGVPCQDERLAYFRTFNVTRRPSEVYSLDVGQTDRARYGTVRPGGPGTSDNENGTCEQFAGYTGELFPSRIDGTKPITLILPDLCQRFTLEYERDALVNGMLGYKYVGKVVEALSSRHSEGTATEQCVDPAKIVGRFGMLISNECHGLPLYRSGSHESLGGTKDAPAAPDGTKQEIYFVLEPNTGTVLESFISMQYHTLLTPNTHIALFQDVPVLRVPLFRFERLYRVSDANSLKLKHMLHLLDVGHQAALAGCALGGLIVLLTVVYACWKARKPDTSHQRKMNAEYSIVGAQLATGSSLNY